MPVIKNALGQSHDIIKRVVQKGDTVIDATAGNGNDTVMLAELVGDMGRVYSFDIQEVALESTAEKLQRSNLSHRVELIKSGHQNMDMYVAGKVKAVMFNLGYLPRGNHKIATKGDTTILAVEKAMKLLDVNGAITIVVYYGGDSGFDEKDEIMEYIKGIDNRQYTVMKVEFSNQVNCPPMLICIEKLSE